ncbi:MAG: hypothetical protein D6710_01415 [Nitrospirae bacterium]|nr:MAG: hypothetical protein D6710_01415 [Nitrospirota bacterium]
MIKKLQEDIIEEGFSVLKEHLGIARTAIFLEIIGKGVGNSLEEIESKTKNLSKEEALEFINRCKKERARLWERIKAG